MAKNLRKGDETRRRWKIIAASRNADADSLPQLLGHLESEAPGNQRHIVRALGKIGGRQAEAKLIEMLDTRQGLILGDVVHALGQLQCQRAISKIRALSKHDSTWVRQNAAFALAKLKKPKRK